MNKSENIALTNLTLNTENPRFELVNNQREAIEMMVNHLGDKLINLAKDIVESESLNPGELIFVTPNKKDKGKYNVLEGNRRITVLKLLSNSDIIDGVNPSFSRKLQPLSEKFKKKPILNVPCVVFKNSDEANRWINLRHTGENEGVGIVKWDTTQQQRFEERHKGVSHISLQVIDFLRKNELVEDSLKQKLNTVPATSLNRLITDKNVQQVIGISIINGKLRSNLQKEEVTKGLVKIVKDLVDKVIKVKNIYTGDDRKKYIETFTTNEIANKRKKSASEWELNSPISTTKKITTPIKKAIPLSTDRETIIRRDFIIPIADSRVNKIYMELKDLKVETFTNAGGVLLRVFIELSMMHI